MMNEIKVSVLMPSLNVGKYIRECIESVVNQTLKDIEIICVDAGSTDGTLEVLKEYAERDGRIRLLHSEKKSYGYQMNMGLDAARGEYIGIVETDDFVPPEMFEELYQTAKQYDVDFVKADFFRFTGELGEYNKTLQKLTANKSFYNRVVNVEHERECFTFQMNTWSGIYKNEFIWKNNIRHHESPGSCFADNGFWFQTFIHAKRVYFSDKPYYMNRRDNPNSSVANKNNVFRMCDEYAFVLNLLKKNEVLFEKYKGEYAAAYFRNCNWVLGWIPYDQKEALLSRMHDDLCSLFDEGLIDVRLFDDGTLARIFKMIYAPDVYYHENFAKKAEFYQRLKKAGNVIVYGAGKIGKAVMDELIFQISPEYIVGFAVTDKDGNPEEYRGMKIYELSELMEYAKKSAIVIATGKKYQDEIMSILTKNGFSNIVFMP